MRGKRPSPSWPADLRSILAGAAEPVVEQVVGEGGAMTPKSNPLTADALSLATDVLEVSIDAKENVVTKDEWNRVAYYHLIQAPRTLAGVHILVSNGIVDPAGPFRPSTTKNRYRHS